jgi:hypothetical protein
MITVCVSKAAGVGMLFVNGYNNKQHFTGLPWDATKGLQPGTILKLNPRRLGQPRFDDP